MVSFSVQSFAQLGPSQLNISGGLFNPNGTPVTNSNVSFKLEIFDPAGTCVLYSEQHLAQDLSASKGGFALPIGAGASKTNNIDAGSPNALSSKVFLNSGVVAPFAGCAAGVTLNAGDSRLIRVQYDLGSGFVAMSPDVPIASSAYAMIADSLQGKTPSDFVQLRDDATYDLNQANVESVFSAANFAKLIAILSGSASNQRLTNVVDPTAASDAATKGYADANVGGKIVDVSGVGPAAGNGQTLIWDQAQNKWVTGVPSAIDASKLPLAGGTMTGAIDMGANNIVNIGHMTMAAQRTLNLGTYTDAQETTLVAGLGAVDKGKVWFNTNSNTFKVWDGSAAVNSFAPSGAAGGDLTGTYPNPTIAANAVVASKINTDAVTTAKINKANAVAGGTLMMVDTVDTSRVEYKSCALGEALMWTAGGWACTNVAGFLGTSGVTAATYGSATQVGQFAVDAQGRITSASNVAITFPVTSVAGKTGAVTLNTADITNAGTAATKDYGTAAGNLVELDGTGKIPVGLMPTAMGDIQDVVPGSGLTGGGSSGAVTLSVDTGTTTGKIVAMAASNKLPAVDGSDLTNVNAVKLQSRDVAATAPTADQVLTWNNAAAAWEPRALPAGNIGDITSVSNGTGLTGGGATGDVTLNVDVGTTTGKIVQMAASDKLPAVDGSNLTGITASQVSGAFANGGNTFGGAATLGTNDNFALSLKANNATAMTILPSGLVGVGTTAPQVSLDIAPAASGWGELNVWTTGANHEAALKLSTKRGTSWGAADHKVWSVAATSDDTVTSIKNDFTIRYFDGSTLTIPFLIDSVTGNVGIGTTSPGTRLTVSDNVSALPPPPANTTVHIGGADGTTDRLLLDSFGAGGNHPNIIFRTAGGTASALAPSASGDILGQLSWWGYGTTGYSGGAKAAVRATAANAWTDASQGAYLSFYTTAVGGVSSSERLRITDAGNIGIGTATPTTKLTISGSGANGIDLMADTGTPTISERLFLSTSTAGQSIALMNSAGSWDFKNGATPGTSSGTTRMLIDTNGNVGIGTTGPADKLHVAGDIRVGTGTTGCVKDADGTVIAGTCSSDVRFKTDIEPLGSRLEQVSQLRPVTYKWRSEEFPDKHFGHETETGLIAQEVQQAIPELVAEDEEGYLKVRFTELNIYILQAVKDLYNRIVGIESHQAIQDRQIASKADKAETEALRTEVKAKDQEIAKLKADAEKQKQENAEMKARLDKIEKMLKSK